MAELERRHADRLRVIDWLRGLSVLLMLAAHSLAFLTHAHDDDRLRHTLHAVNGLPGPTFILTAGFSLAFVTARDGDTPSRRRGRALKSLKRIGQVLLGSLVLRHTMWDAFHYVERFAWIDVLTCIALMLLILWVVLFALPRAMRVVSIAMLAVGFFAVSPWVASPRSFGWATTLLNNSVYVDTWPLVPWAGYGFVGALIGLAAGRSRRPRRLLATAFGVLVVAGLLIAHSAGAFRLVDQSIDAWMIDNAGERIWRIAVVGLVLLGLERAGVTLENGPARIVGLFSRQSLIAYVGHQILIYGYWKFRPLNRFINATDWWGYLALSGVVIGVMAGVCWGVEVGLRWWRGRAASKLAG